MVPYFPPDNMAEFLDFKYYGLRSASAYILVYDVTAPSTFQFIKTLREQMLEARDMTNIPVLVVANKMDLETASKISSRDPQGSSSNNNHHSSHLHFSHHHPHTHKQQQREQRHHHSHSQHHHQRTHNHHSHHGSKTEKHGEGGTTVGIVTETSSAAASVPPVTIATTCSTTDSFYHHSRPSSNPQVNNSSSASTNLKPNPVSTQNGTTAVAKSTKGKLNISKYFSSYIKAYLTRFKCMKIVYIIKHLYVWFKVWLQLHLFLLLRQQPIINPHPGTEKKSYKL